MRRTLVILGAAIFVAGSIAVIAAQHREAAAPPHRPLELLHSLCADPNATAGQAAKAHVPEHFTKMLDLSSAQLAEIERMAGEACVVVTRTHEGILQVLTPEQREKIRKLHGDDHPDGLVGLVKRLHGGR